MLVASFRDPEVIYLLHLFEVFVISDREGTCKETMTVHGSGKRPAVELALYSELGRNITEEGRIRFILFVRTIFKPIHIQSFSKFSYSFPYMVAPRSGVHLLERCSKKRTEE